ncbi:putative sugar efflux transporter [Kaistia sp. 32K]|uniref:MFS transporter n=1 Tax=Kaistia sp. 32K TaxID=2795690 RepID=UPI001935DF8D|nr:MFS transporter [Kaistia sp. 32K]BCP54861.1 putative sugar efflux transporter [Kaistia sp. 32K]
MTLTASRRISPLQELWSSPLYRGATLAMFLSGLGTSAAAPQIVLFLVRELGTSLPMAGLYYLTSLTAPIAGYLVGSYSDRTGGRLGLFRLCAIAGFVGWAGFAVSTQAWIPFAIGAVILAFSGAAASQIFAAVHDELVRNPGKANDDVVAIIRMALTAGWVIGPALGAWFASETSLRALFWATAICFLAQIVPLGRLKVSAPSRPKTAADPEAASVARFGAMLPLLAFTALFVLVYAGEAIKYGFLLLYMEEHLRIAPGVRGAIIGVQPLIELIIMPFSVVLGRRFGPLKLMAFAAALCVAANLCFAGWPSVAGMFAGQILMGGVWGLFAVLGILVAQRLLPGAVATASAIFMSSSALSSAVGGVAGSIGVAAFGLPSVFYIPAVFAALAVLGLAAMARRHPLR